MKTLLATLILILLGLASHIVANSNKTYQVTCVEHVTVDSHKECAIFEWRGQTYATEHAPITRYEAIK